MSKKQKESGVSMGEVRKVFTAGLAALQKLQPESQTLVAAAAKWLDYLRQESVAPFDSELVREKLIKAMVAVRKEAVTAIPESENEPETSSESLESQANTFKRMFEEYEEIVSNLRPVASRVEWLREATKRATTATASIPENRIPEFAVMLGISLPRKSSDYRAAFVEGIQERLQSIWTRHRLIYTGPE